MPVFVATDENLRKFKKTITDYLSGTTVIEGRRQKFLVEDAKQAFLHACSDGLVKISAKEFCKKIRIISTADDEALDPVIIQILEHLNLSTEKLDYAETPNLYLLLNSIKQRDETLDYLIEIIDTTQAPTPWIYYCYPPMLATIGTLTVCYFEPQYFWLALDWITNALPALYHWVYHYLVQLHNLPLLGITGQLCLLAYYVYATFEYGLDASADRIRALGFRFIAITLNILAHTISYLAAGTLPLFPALLFISSAMIGIVESIYRSWSQDPLNLQSEPSAYKYAHETSQKMTKHRNQHILLIEGMYAVVITSMVVVWSVLPPSVFLTITYMLSMWLALIIKDYWIATKKYQAADEIQEARFNIYQQDPRAQTLAAIEKCENVVNRELREMQYSDPDKATACAEHWRTIKTSTPSPVKGADLIRRFKTFSENYDEIKPKIVSKLGTTPLTGQSLFQTPGTPHRRAEDRKQSPTHPIGLSLNSQESEGSPELSGMVRT